MKYDFTSIIDRRGWDAIAVDSVYNDSDFGPDAPKEGFDVIPMWVADMNFPVLPTIQEAIHQRVDHPAYGYFSPRREYTNSIISWQEQRNGVTGLKAEHIGYENGVLGGVLSVLGVICSKGDNVLVHAPTYIGFTSSLENNGYHIVHSHLVKDEENIWRMDFEDMEKKSRKTIFMRLFSALRTIRAAAYGNAGKSRKPWRFTRNMMCLLSLMRFGLTLLCQDISIFQPSLFQKMQRAVLQPCMHLLRPLIWQDW